MTENKKFKLSENAVTMIIFKNVESIIKKEEGFPYLWDMELFVNDEGELDIPDEVDMQTLLNFVNAGLESMENEESENPEAEKEILELTSPKKEIPSA